MTKTRIDLDQKELRLLVQSLENCLGTCKTKAGDPDAPCEDCDSARALKDRLKKHVRA